jgi:hypothetical protein
MEIRHRDFNHCATHARKTSKDEAGRWANPKAIAPEMCDCKLSHIEDMTEQTL